MRDRWKDCSDEELIIRLREGEQEVMDYLMDKYKNLVRDKAKSMYILGGDTEDLIQEGMIGLFKAVLTAIRFPEAHFPSAHPYVLSRLTMKYMY